MSSVPIAKSLQLLLLKTAYKEYPCDEVHQRLLRAAHETLSMEIQESIEEQIAKLESARRNSKANIVGALKQKRRKSKLFVDMKFAQNYSTFGKESSMTAPDDSSGAEEIVPAGNAGGGDLPPLSEAVPVYVSGPSGEAASNHGSATNNNNLEVPCQSSPGTVELESHLSSLRSQREEVRMALTRMSLNTLDGEDSEEEFDPSQQKQRARFAGFRGLGHSRANSEAYVDDRPNLLGAK